MSAPPDEPTPPTPPTPPAGAASNGFEYGKDGPRRLVVGLDGSRTSWRAAAYAAGLARRNRATLIVVHVTGVKALAGLTPQAAALDVAAEDEWSEQLRGELVSAAEQGRIGDTEVIFERRQGEPAHEIAASADAHQADGVIVGASEARGHRLMGSTAVRLVKAGRWPVTVVP